MAGSSDSTSAILRSPRQASYTFAQNGSQAPRQKHLFVVTFHKNSSSSSASSVSGWETKLSFLVKTAERPSVQPQTEEIKQYNKNRVIYTGVKYQPVRISFYDTVDSMAMQMWNEYAKTYFGAFNHDDNRNDYTSDVVSKQFLDDAGKGYGFAPIAVTSSSNDANAQYFFDYISIYEVWDGNYVQTDLINPRIQTFEPEAFSYEDAQVGTINMTVAYEAIVYRNSSVPQDLSADDELSAMFASDNLYGDVGQNEDITSISFPTQSYAIYDALGTGDYFIDTNSLPTYTVSEVIQPYSSNSVLSLYGSLNFGTESSMQSTSDYMANNNPNISILLGGLSPSVNSLDSQEYNTSGPGLVSANVIDTALATTVSLSGSQSVVGPLLTQIISAELAITNSSSDVVSVLSNNGLQLNNSVINELNKNSTGSVQYGCNASET